MIAPCDVQYQNWLISYRNGLNISILGRHTLKKHTVNCKNPLCFIGMFGDGLCYVWEWTLSSLEKLLPNTILKTFPGIARWPALCLLPQTDFSLTCVYQGRSLITRCPLQSLLTSWGSVKENPGPRSHIQGIFCYSSLSWCSGCNAMLSSNETNSKTCT